MLWQFDFASDIPLYLQLRNQVVLSISNGELKPGDKLPTVRALSDESGINAMTISKGYQLLKAEGYVSTDRRSGTVVSPEPKKPALPEPLAQRLRLVLAELKLQGICEEDILAICREYLKE